MREDAEHEELTRAGWAPVAGDAGWWLDPASGQRTPQWRALELARRDRGEVLDREALRTMRQAVQDLELDVLQLDLEAKRVVVRKGDPTAANRAVRDVTEALNALRRKASDAAREIGQVRP